MSKSQRRNLLSDIELVEYAQRLAETKPRTLKKLKSDTVRDAIVYQDRSTGEQRSLPNKFIRAIGESATFELVDPTLNPEEGN